MRSYVKSNRSEVRTWPVLVVSAAVPGSRNGREWHMNEQNEPSLAPLLEALIAEQRETNQLLSILIEALAEENVVDDDTPPTHYMDGSLIG